MGTNTGNYVGSRSRIDWFMVLVVALTVFARPSWVSAATCASAARDAEQRSGLPPGLLAAIGHVESGGWEWSVNGNNAAPDGHFSDFRAAEAYTKSLLASGRRLIDIGCFQIDLFYHPQAFARWQDGFDNDRNADAAAGILNQLYRSTGNWNRAVALYHSADPVRGQSYLQAVLAAWKGTGIDLMASSSTIDPYVVAMVSQPAAVAIWVPGTSMKASRTRRGRLPHIVTP